MAGEKEPLLSGVLPRESGLKRGSGVLPTSIKSRNSAKFTVSASPFKLFLVHKPKSKICRIKTMHKYDSMVALPRSNGQRLPRIGITQPVGIKLG